MLFLTLGILISVAFWDYKPGQSRWITTAALDPHGPINLVGKFGATLSFWFSYLLGFTAWFVPVLLFWLAYAFAFRLSHLFGMWKYVFLGIALLSFAGLLSMAETSILSPAFLRKIPTNLYPNGLGGSVGSFLFSGLLVSNLGKFGGTLLLLVTYCVGLVGTFTRAETPAKTFENIQRNLKTCALLSANLTSGSGKRLSQVIKNIFKRDETRVDGVVEKSETVRLPKVKSAKIKEVVPVAKEQQFAVTAPKADKGISKESDNGLKIYTEEKIEKAAVELPVKRGNYIFPTLELLQQPTVQQHAQEDHQQRADNLVKTLAEFGVAVIPAEVHTGPVITRYDVTPAPGVRVEKIANLEKNIALGLKALSVRILAPVPGRGCVGVEIPNQYPMPVCLREIIESTAWANTKAEIPVVLGKEVTGKPLVADLTKMPHLLIAGSTGAVKTVCINAVVASLLYHSSPEDLRFIMVDPKIVEMQLYNSLPHMLIPVVTEPKKVPGALKWLISEMERRYQIFAKMGVRNIAGFNAKVLKDKQEGQKAAALEASLSPEERVAVNNIEVPRDASIEVPKSKLPYIVCIIDELADLMMVAPADIETCIARLAQLARAAGIHLILATQRPSVNVITGVIKANLPCRIAFKVASKVDSRTILDCGGADQLIGRGDMLFLPPGSADLVRAQGAFVSDEEINAIIDFLKQNGPPQIAKHIQQEIDSGDEGGSSDANEWSDDLVPEALEVIRTSQRASTSMLQRRLKIGYNRAARIMEILEDAGYVGPENGAQPREILRDLAPY